MTLLQKNPFIQNLILILLTTKMNNDLVEKLANLENEQLDIHSRVVDLTDRLDKIEVVKKQTVIYFIIYYIN